MVAHAGNRNITPLRAETGGSHIPDIHTQVDSMFKKGIKTKQQQQQIHQNLAIILC